MDYKGYKILAEVQDSTYWEFTKSSPGVYEITKQVAESKADGPSAFVIQNKDGKMVDYGLDLEGALKVIDAL